MYCKTLISLQGAKYFRGPFYNLAFALHVWHVPVSFYVSLCQESKHGFMVRTQVLDRFLALPVVTVKPRANLSLSSPTTKSEGSVAVYLCCVFRLLSLEAL